MSDPGDAANASGEAWREAGHPSQAEPVPEGVNLLHTPERREARRHTDRRRYAIGPFGQTWLWTLGVVLSVAGLYKVIAGPALLASLPTTTGTVTGWVTIPARTITYAPKVMYEVAGHTYRFIAGTTVNTLTDAPTSVAISYVPFDPSVAAWNGGGWWTPFSDVYLMVVLILGLILLSVAVYQRRIRDYWNPTAQPSPSAVRRMLGIGVVGVVAGGAWLIAGYAAPASWFIPPNPNAIAAVITAFGMALLVSGARHRRAESVSSARA